MTFKEKSWPAGTGTTSKTAYPKPNKPSHFPQEPLLRQAHWEAVQSMNFDPTPVNRLIALLVAVAWKKAFMDGGAR